MHLISKMPNNKMKIFLHVVVKFASLKSLVSASSNLLFFFRCPLEHAQYLTWSESLFLNIYITMYVNLIHQNFIWFTFNKHEHLMNINTINSLNTNIRSLWIKHMPQLISLSVGLKKYWFITISSNYDLSIWQKIKNKKTV